MQGAIGRRSINSCLQRSKGIYVCRKQHNRRLRAHARVNTDNHRGFIHNGHALANSAGWRGGRGVVKLVVRARLQHLHGDQVFNAVHRLPHNAHHIVPGGKALKGVQAVFIGGGAFNGRGQVVRLVQGHGKAGYAGFPGVPNTVSWVVIHPHGAADGPANAAWGFRRQRRVLHRLAPAFSFGALSGSGDWGGSGPGRGAIVAGGRTGGSLLRGPAVGCFGGNGHRRGIGQRQLLRERGFRRQCRY